MKKSIITIITLLIILSNFVYTQNITYREGKTLNLSKPKNIGDYKRYCGVYRKINGINQQIGLIKITRFDNNFIHSELVKEFRPYSIKVGDFIDSRLDSIYGDFYPLNYRTISLSIFSDDKVCSDFRLDYSPWFFNWITISIRGLIGNTKPVLSDFLIGFCGGIGNTFQCNRFHLSNMIYYNHIYNPELTREDYKSLGDDLWSYNVELDIRITNFIYTIIGFETYLSDNFKKHDIKQNHFIVGLKFKLNN